MVWLGRLFPGGGSSCPVISPSRFGSCHGISLAAILRQNEDSKESLQMLEQVAAANEAILGKQRETLSQLAQLAEKAQASKSSAARSAEKK
jgi:hypothetical protein